MKLLRILQEGTFRRVGDERIRTSDFRVISATNRSLETLIKAGEFREDRYYRLNVHRLRIPSLRERLGDLTLLAHDMINKKLAPKLGFATRATGCFRLAKGIDLTPCGAIKRPTAC